MDRTGQIRSLARTSRWLGSIRQVKTVLAVAVEEARNLIGAHQGAVSLMGSTSRPGAHAASFSQKYGVRFKPDDFAVADVVLEAFARLQAPLRFTQLEVLAHRAWPGSGVLAAGCPPMCGWIGAPLMSDAGEAMGLLQLSDAYGDEFSANDEILLMEVAKVAACGVLAAWSMEDAEAAQVRMQRLLVSTLDLVCTVTAGGVFEDISENCHQIIGYEAGEVIGKSYLVFVHPDDRERSAVEERNIRADRPSRTFTNRYLHRHGEIVYLHWSAVWSAHEERFFCVGRDMTDRVKLENQLNRALRLEAVGKLTGGMAHDFNNILTIVLGCAESLAEELRNEPSLYELAVLAQDAAERGAELTGRLLAFARQQPLQPKAVDAVKLVASMAPLIRNMLTEDIELKIVGPASAWECHADPVQLESAILNLCINARDALPAGGLLLIETSDAILDATSLSQNDEVASGEYLKIVVTDGGCGMDAETLEHAFEPFFTTKPVGQGAGLGLSMVHGFIKQSNGYVEIASEVGVGTAVSLYLPRSQERDGRVELPVEQSIPAGVAHVLVVEDDRALRSHVAMQLRSLGYRVTAAENVLDALDAVARNADLDLLFTDVVMPGMNGAELARQARLMQPTLKVLYTSGYTENTIVHKGRLDPGVSLLHKPYRKRDLALKVREALAANIQAPA